MVWCLVALTFVFLFLLFNGLYEKLTNVKYIIILIKLYHTSVYYHLHFLPKHFVFIPTAQHQQVVILAMIMTPEKGLVCKR